MRKMLVVLAALLLAATSAQAAYVISLEGVKAAAPAVDTYTVSMTMEGDGLPNEFGSIGWVGAQTKLAALPAGWVVSGLAYNTVDFDAAQSAGTALNGLIGINADIMAIGSDIGGNWVGYTTVKKTLLTFTLVAPTNGTLGLDAASTLAFDGDNGMFNGVAPGVDLTLVPLQIPEPATALLLIGALPFLRRRRA